MVGLVLFYIQINVYVMIVALIDNGHGYNTPGKCSPDKSVLEYAYVREITKRIYDKLTA